LGRKNKYMKTLGQVLAALGAVLLGYFGLIGVDTGIDGVRVANIGGTLVGSAMLVSGSVFAAAGEITERLSELHATPRKVIAAETKPVGRSLDGSVETKPVGRSQDGSVRKGEERLVEEYKGTPINQRYNGYFVGENWFVGVVRARQFIDNSNPEFPDDERG
jgi:hypothetical protein